MDAIYHGGALLLLTLDFVFMHAHPGVYRNIAITFFYCVLYMIWNAIARFANDKAVYDGLTWDSGSSFIMGFGLLIITVLFNVIVTALSNFKLRKLGYHVDIYSKKEDS